MKKTTELNRAIDFLFKGVELVSKRSYEIEKTSASGLKR